MLEHGIQASSGIATPHTNGVVNVEMGADMSNTRVTHRVLVHGMQVPSTSRACSGAGTSRGTTADGNCSAAVGSVVLKEAVAQNRDPKLPSNRTEAAPRVIALREGDALPEGYTYAVRAGAKIVSTDKTTMKECATVVDLCIPPNACSRGSDGPADATKTAAARRRSRIRKTNKQANATYALQMKELLTGGRTPTITATKTDTHLKSRWHAAAKTIVYNLMEFKEGWKGYSIFEKGLIHQEPNAQYKFDSPMDLKLMEKYLAGHLRTSRAVWKTQW